MSLRQSNAGLHTWSGLIVGWLLYAIALSGTATVLRNEFSGWMRPEISNRAAPDRAIGAAIDWLTRAHPKAQGWYLTAPDERTPWTQAAFDDPDAPRGYSNLALDPVTGRPDGIRATLGGEFLYRFHFELKLPYPWGRIVASAAGMLMLIALVSGIIIHARIFKDLFTLRPGKGKRSWLDAHNVLGVLAMPFHLMIAATGILTLLSLTLPWATVAAYGDDRAAAFAEASPGLISREPSGQAHRLAPIGPMLAEAQRRFADARVGGGRIGRVSIANPGDRESIVTISNHDGDQLAYAARTVTFEGRSGRVIGHYVEERPAQTSFAVLYGLHMGRFAPWVSRWLYTLCGLALCATIATGLVLWLESRPAAKGIGPKLVARINVGIIAGMPIAMLAFLWANRLLPLGIEGREGQEVAAFFWTWGAALLAGFLLPVRRGWIALFGVAALGALLLPFASFALTGRGLWSAWTTGDSLFAGFDMGLFACAALCAAIAHKVWRHQPRAPRTRRAVPAAVAA